MDGARCPVKLEKKKARGRYWEKEIGNKGWVLIVSIQLLEGVFQRLKKKIGFAFLKLGGGKQTKRNGIAEWSRGGEREKGKKKWG